MLMNGNYIMFEHEGSLVSTTIDIAEKDEVIVSFFFNNVSIKRNVHKSCIVAIGDINGVAIPPHKGNWHIIDNLCIKKHLPKS